MGWSGSDSGSRSGARRAPRLLLATLLFLGSAASAAPPWSAQQARAEGIRLAQAPDTSGVDDGDDEDDDDENDVPIPPNLLENDNPSAPDSTGVPRDSGAAVRPGADSAKAFQTEEPETLHSVPGGFRGAASPGAPPGAPEPTVPKTKPPRGPFGLSPFFLILGLAAVHIFVVRTIGD